jgi:hypothetical protein
MSNEMLEQSVEKLQPCVVVGLSSRSRLGDWQKLGEIWSQDGVLLAQSRQLGVLL